MPTAIANEWETLLQEEMDKPYYKDLQSKLAEEYKEKTIYPEESRIFQALRWTAYDNVKVVILGQDPYHGPGQAHGLSFSVLPGVKQPPSLKNILKELNDDLGCAIPNHGSLEHWARQGVLLLNAVLTVREGEANSHRKLGWEKLTDRIIALLNERERPIVFILWGRHAQEKALFVDDSRHLVLRSVHPSPLSAYNGFFGSKPFSKANEFLTEAGEPGIDWQIPDL